MPKTSSKKMSTPGVPKTAPKSEEPTAGELVGKPKSKTRWVVTENGNVLDQQTKRVWSVQQMAESPLKIANAAKFAQAMNDLHAGKAVR